MLDSGVRLGPYEIVRSLGGGGMGNVYLARDTRLGRTVVVKTIKDDTAARPDALARFRNEARAASALNHPSIVHIYEIESAVPADQQGRAIGDQPVLYIAMEHVRGETLRDRLRRGPDAATIVALHAQLAEALARAHEAGIVHRDLKPENVMVAEDELVKILDFGLAKLVEPERDVQSDEVPTTPISEADGVLMGTASYMAPEQLRGQEADSRTDLFALGCMLYEALSGRHPFRRRTTLETIHAVAYERPSPPSTFDPTIPRPLDVLILRCLAKEPDDRHGSARQLAHDLREAARSLSGEVPLVSPVRAQSSSWRLMLASLVAAILAGVAWLALQPGSGDRGERAATRDPTLVETIAVFPFANRSNDHDLDYLSDGIAEGLTYELSRTRSLRVMPRSSVVAIDRGVVPREAGRTLGADAVVSGELEQTSSTLVIRAELVDVGTGALLWGERYEGAPSDLIDIQRDIEREIRFVLRREATSATVTTTDPEAYRLYLRGRYHWNKRTADGLQLALVHFQQALERDPAFALAWVGLGDSYALLEQYAGVPSKENCPRAKAAILRAQQIDPALAQSYASSGLLLGHCDWNWAGSQAAFERALELDPNYATAYHWYALHLAYRGLTGRGREMAAAAQEHDPLSLIANNAMSVVEGSAENWDAVLTQSDRLIEMNRNFPVAHMWKGRALRAMGRHDEALSELETAWQLSGEKSLEIAGEIGGTLALSGDASGARQWIARLQGEVGKNPAAAYPIAAIHASLGQEGEALDWLDRAFEVRSWFLVQLAVEPLFEPLRDQPRFREMVERVNLRLERGRDQSTVVSLQWSQRTVERAGDPAGAAPSSVVEKRPTMIDVG